MSRQKLSYEQKIFKVCNVLENAEMPLSVTAIGKRCGYATGTPIREIMRSLYVAGLFEVHYTMVAGKKVELFYLSDEGRSKCVDFLRGK